MSLVFEGDAVGLCEVHIGRNNLKVASLMLSTSGERMHVIHMQLYAEKVFKHRDLCVDPRHRCIIPMLHKLLGPAGPLADAKRPKVIGSSQPAKTFIHFKDIEDFFHWVLWYLLHGGYINIQPSSLQT